MRLGMVVHAYYPHDVRVRRQCEALADRGDTVDLVCLRADGETPTETIWNVNVHRLPVRHRRGQGPVGYLFEYTVFFILASIRLAALSVRHRYPVVQVHNMPDILAATGVEQLKKSDRFYETRRRYASMYTDAFAELEEVISPHEDSDGQHAWHLYVVLLRLERLKIGRARFIEELRTRNIGTSVHFIPLHLHPYYQKTFCLRRGNFPNAEWVYDRCISLPLYSGMAEEDVWFVAEAFRDIIKTFRR